MIAAVIEKVVRDRLGLDPAALGTSVLDRVIEVRMKARGITEPSLYAARLMTESAERDALAADLVVPETWFFRGSHALFDRFAAFVLRCAQNARGPVRILSAPCSTGEEPYSLALAFHNHLTGPIAYTIDAIDLSERNLGRAAEARYPSSAFREPGPDPRPAYFRKTGDVWELFPHIRSKVRFLVGNLADPLLLAGERPYDLILCRNAFIYLTPDAKQRAMMNFDRLLALHGWLCVTPAEAERLPPGRFVPEGPNMFGIYRRVEVDTLLPATRIEQPLPIETPAPVPRAPQRDTNGLTVARRLADIGRLTDARAECESFLRVHPTSADALALLGVIHLATGNEDAAFTALGKALYLAPDHPEALSHMIGLCDRRGNSGRAAALRKRLARSEGA